MLFIAVFIAIALLMALIVIVDMFIHAMMCKDIPSIFMAGMSLVVWMTLAWLGLGCMSYGFCA